MPRNERHELDPVAKRLLVGLGVIVLAIVAGIAGALFVAPEPVDERWAVWDQPTVVGELLEDNVRATRTTSQGVPVASRTNEVTLAFRRCGPVADVDVLSTRTWVVRTLDEEFLGFEGQTVAVTILNADGGCVTFDLTYPIPNEVAAAVACCDDTVELRFSLDPVDEGLGSVVIESEPFTLWRPDLPNLSTEIVDLEAKESE